MAVKIVDMTDVPLKFYEIGLMKRLKHLNITKLVTGFVESNIKILVMPFVSTDLFDYILDKAINHEELLSEKNQTYSFICLVQNICTKMVTHRDFKLNNSLITGTNKMVILDFDFTIKVFDRFCSIYPGNNKIY